MITNNAMEVVEHSDAELVARSLAGDRDAFSHIVTRYQNLICSLAYSGMGNLGQSEDLAQETFITAWRHLSRLREPEKLRSWLCGIVRNRIRKSLKREGREPASEALSIEDAPEPAATEALPSDQTISKEEQAILWRALERIPETYREPLILFYREHQSVECVAQELDLTEDAAKQRLSRGRKMLQEEIATFVEGALGRSAPGQAFSCAVLAAIPFGTGFATAGGAGLVGKSTAVAKSGGWAATLGAWFAPVLGIVSAIVAHWIIVKAAPTPRERRIKIIAFGALWTFILAWLLAVQPAIRALGRSMQWSDHTLFAVLAGSWWIYAAFLATLGIIMFRTAIAAASLGDPTVAQPPPMKTGQRIAVIVGVYLACGAWLINAAWLAGDHATAATIAASMVVLGVVQYFRLMHATSRPDGMRITAQHLALVWIVILATLNLRLESWLAVSQNINIESMRQLLPASTVPVLTLALLAWCAIVMAATRPRPIIGEPESAGQPRGHAV